MVEIDIPNSCHRTLFHKTKVLMIKDQTPLQMPGVWEAVMPRVFGMGKSESDGTVIFHLYFYQHPQGKKNI